MDDFTTFDDPDGIEIDEYETAMIEAFENGTLTDEAPTTPNPEEGIVSETVYATQEAAEAAAENTDQAPVEAAPAEAPKRRGRPKGSKNKVSSKGTVVVEKAEKVQGRRPRKQAAVNPAASAAAAVEAIGALVEAFKAQQAEAKELRATLASIEKSLGR